MPSTAAELAMELADENFHFTIVHTPQRFLNAVNADRTEEIEGQVRGITADKVVVETENYGYMTFGPDFWNQRYGGTFQDVSLDDGTIRGTLLSNQRVNRWIINWVREHEGHETYMELLDESDGNAEPFREAFIERAGDTQPA